MDGLTAKVFRTYNASITLQQQLNEKSTDDYLGSAVRLEMLYYQSHFNLLFSVAEKVLTYNQANRAVAVLCNHRKTVSKNFDDQMDRMDEKITDKEEKIAAKKAQIKDAKRDGVST